MHSARSDHPDHHDTTLVQSFGVSELKGGTDVLAKSSPPGSEGDGATPAGTPSARLPASPSPAEAVSDPQGFDLTVAAIKSSAVNSPQGLSITQPSGARTGVQSYVPADDLTGFTAGGGEAIQLQLQQFVQCTEWGAATLISDDIEAIAMHASELRSAGERHVAAAERLKSFREEQRSFHTVWKESQCDAKQAAAIYSQRLANEDFSTDGKFTEAVLNFNVLNGELNAFDAEAAEEQASWSSSTAPPASNSFRSRRGCCTCLRAQPLPTLLGRMLQHSSTSSRNLLR